MNELLQHIKQLNEKTQKWVDEDPKNRWAGMLTEDLEHWKEYGVTTPEEFDRYMLMNDVYELTQDKWGYKPSWQILKGMSIEELKAEVESLCKLTSFHL